MEARDLIGPTVAAWLVLAAALAAGGGDGVHYWTALGAFAAAAGLAMAAWRLKRRRLAGLILVAPPLVAAGAVALFVIRLIAGFFG